MFLGVAKGTMYLTRDGDGHTVFDQDVASAFFVSMTLSCLHESHEPVNQFFPNLLGNIICLKT